MTALQISIWSMLLFEGLWAGGVLMSAVDRTSVWRRMPLDEYAIDFRRHLFRADPMQPILLGIGGVGAIYFALNSSGEAALLAWIAVALIALVFIVSVSFAEPINSKFRRLPEGQIPERAEFYRTFWRRFHRTRCVVAIIVLGLLSAAVAI